MDVVRGRAGNLWAWTADPDAAVAAGRRGLVRGSHLDSVPDGGAYDGPLGVVSAFAALDALRARGFRPGRPLGVVRFVDEEGARFGVACAGSRVLTGALAPERALALTDADGATLDARGADEDAVAAAVAQVERSAALVGAVLQPESWTPATPFDGTLAARLTDLLDAPPVLSTGAGHDAGILANAGVPAGMLFV